MHKQSGVFVSCCMEMCATEMHLLSFFGNVMLHFPTLFYSSL